MQITEITASWTETANLGNYSNVKPSLTLKATLAPGEDRVFAELELMIECKAFVQEQVDQALEREQQAAKYSTDPRYDICYSGYRTKIAVLVPHGTLVDGAGRIRENFRYAAALAYLAELYGEATWFDCADGQIERAVLAIAKAEAARDAKIEADRQEMLANARRSLVPAGEPDPDDEADEPADDEDDEE